MLQTQDDSIQSHTHSVTDPGHTHGYIDKWPNFNDPRHNKGTDDDKDHWGPEDGDKQYDRFDKSHNSTSNSAASGVTVTGVQGARVDSETRPKNLRVVYIMRVF